MCRKKTDLALSITKNINNSEFTVLLILIILFTTIFFCHGLVRLCMLIIKPPSEEDERRHQLPQMYGPGGYAIPRRPIRVLLARDEEAAGVESEATKVQPPAYGLWRESVVCSFPCSGVSPNVPGRQKLLLTRLPREWTPTAFTGSATKKPQRR